MNPYYLLIDNLFVFSAYLCLLLALMSLWIYNKLWVWSPLAIGALGCGYAGGVVGIPILIPITTLIIALIALSFRTPPVLRLFIVTIAGCSAFALFTHSLEGTHNLKLFQGHIKENSLLYTMYWNFDKGLAGLLLLALGIPLLSDPMHVRLVAKQTIMWAGMTIAGLLGLAYGVGLIQFDPSLPSFLPLWIVSNLFFTCMAEEALFRGLLQKELTDMLPVRWGWIGSILLIATLFAAVHAFSLFDVRYALLSFSAGLFYGLTYATTRSIEASIAVHFLVNTTHIVFFSYPFLT